MKKELLVAGLGNRSMGDEGVGGYIVELLSKQAANGIAEFVDAGTMGIRLLHLIANRRKVIFIDCAYMRTKPGTIKKFTPEKVKSVKKFGSPSLHKSDLLKIIEMSKQLGEAPREIVIFGIEPAEVREKTGLSKTIAEKIDEYISIIGREIHIEKTEFNLA
jgi:hydrogenase maturation protease